MHLRNDYLITAHSAINQPFHCQAIINQPEANPDLAGLIGSPHSLALPVLDGQPAVHLNGIVNKAVSGADTTTSSTYTLHLRPWFYLLKQEHACALFQNQSVPEIVKQVCRQAGFTQVKEILSREYPRREYVTQYNESSFAFLSRLLAEAGIFYFFTHSDKEHTLVLGDSPQAFQPCVESLEWLGGSFPQTPSDHIWNLRLTHSGTPASAQVDDYNYLTPATSLNASTSQDFPCFGQFGTGQTTVQQGEQMAGQRLDALQGGQLELSASSACTALHVGGTFNLKNSPYKELNHEWVVTTLSMRIGQDNAVRAELRARPAQAVRAPALVRPRPTVPGPLTGVVVGKQGEEIWTDAHGRVKVRPHWNRQGKDDESASCWLRVAQPWAGNGYGAMFIPRVGQEVVISFVGGDPDRPLVTGTLYNAANTPPWSLPEAAACTGWKGLSTPEGAEGNEICLDDSKDKERLYLHAQKLLECLVEEEKRLTIKGEGGEKVLLEKGSRLVEIKEGDDNLKVKGQRVLEIEGDYTISVKGNLIIKSDGDIKIEAGGALSLLANQALQLEAGTDLKLQAGTEFSLQGSTAGKVDGGGQLEIKGGLVKVN